MRLPSAQSIYDAYVKDLRQGLRPTEVGKTVILSALRQGMTPFQEHPATAIQSYTHDDICPELELIYEDHCGAAFLSVCTRTRPLHRLCRRHPFVLDILIYVAEALGVGDMLQRAEQQSGVSLFLTICVHFSELAMRLLRAPQQSKMFPNVTQQGTMFSSSRYPYSNSILCHLSLGQYKNLAFAAVTTIHNNNVKKALMDLFIHFHFRHMTVISELLARVETDPGIFLMCKQAKSNILLHCLKNRCCPTSEFKFAIEDLYNKHSVYTTHVISLLVPVSHIGGVRAMVKDYLFVVDTWNTIFNCYTIDT